MPESSNNDIKSDVNFNNTPENKPENKSEKVRMPLYAIVQNHDKSTDLFKNPDDPESVKKVHEFIDPYIREELSWRFGNKLGERFDEAVEHISNQLFHVKNCRPFYSEIDIKRLIGTEIGYINTFEEDYRRDPLNFDGRNKQRESFLNCMSAGFSPLTDPNSPSRRMIELDKYMTSWADFPAFGFDIPMLDRATGGIMPGEICVLTGAPGTMKTSLALNAALNAVNKINTKNNTVLYFSVDMAPRDITMRLLEREAKIPESRLRAMLAANPRDETISAFRGKIYEKYDTKMSIFGHSPNVMLNIKRVLNRCLIRRPGLVIIDYLTRLKTPGQSDLEFVEEAVPQILSFAQQYETAFLLLNQMGRASRSEQASGRTGGHSRGGGIIEEVAHTEIELFQQINSNLVDLRGGYNYNYELNFSDYTPPQPLIIACVTKARRGVSGQYFSLGYQGNIKMFDGTAQRVKLRSRKNVIFELV